jgi:hypothetical protein
MPIAPTLERQRLEQRIKRLTLVIAALEDRLVYREALTGGTPRPLRRAIADFRVGLAGRRRRLRELER